MRGVKIEVWGVNWLAKVARMLKGGCHLLPLGFGKTEKRTGKGGFLSRIQRPITWDRGFVSELRSNTYISKRKPGNDLVKRDGKGVG